MNSLAVRIQDLQFSYPAQSGVCIHQINLEIPAGQRFGLFGPNGAGKTTLMYLMTGLLSYEHGSVELLGNEMKHHPRLVNRLFGFVPQDFSFYHELSPAENLSFFGAWCGLTRTEIKNRSAALLEVLGLEEVRNKPVHTFSGGMKRRMNLAIAVIHQPRVLFLDEPTVGVDVQSRHAIIQYLRSLNENGTTLVYTSHQLDEAAELCETIALIDNGKIVAHDLLEKLLQEHRQEGLEGLFLTLTGKKFRD